MCGWSCFLSESQGLGVRGVEELVARNTEIVTIRNRKIRVHLRLSFSSLSSFCPLSRCLLSSSSFFSFSSFSSFSSSSSSSPSSSSSSSSVSFFLSFFQNFLFLYFFFLSFFLSFICLLRPTTTLLLPLLLLLLLLSLLFLSSFALCSLLFAYLVSPVPARYPTLAR
jgi:hypothetical protein